MMVDWWLVPLASVCTLIGVLLGLALFGGRRG
jgi:hypothetical protein